MDLKENRGVIFRNKKKTDNKHPDYRGEIDVNGERYEISLWENDDKNGGKYFSASISEPYRKPALADEVPAKIEEQGEDLPF